MPEAARTGTSALNADASIGSLGPHPVPARWVERWWRGEAGIAGRLLDLTLAPAERCYRAASAWRNAAYDSGRRRTHRVQVPVISVGNLAVGGTGKTPVTRWLAGELTRRGLRPAILHGGYASDEPALHRQWFPELPVLAQRDRVAAAHTAIEAGATALLLDDGFQHRRLERSVDLVLLAAENWTESPRLLPRGPWREPPTALRRASVTAVTRRTAGADQARAVGEVARCLNPMVPVIQLFLAPGGWSTSDSGWQPRSTSPPGEALVVAGIARPDWFVGSVRAAGARVAGLLPFPDHHAYGPRDVERIRRTAAGRPIVTTAKDMVKLAGIAAGLDIWVLEQTVIVEEGQQEMAALLDGLAP